MTALTSTERAAVFAALIDAAPPRAVPTVVRWIGEVAAEPMEPDT